MTSNNCSVGSIRLIAVVTLFLFTGCTNDACPDAFTSWCDDNIYYYCDNAGSHGISDPPNDLTATHCDDYGATCIEETFDGSDLAYCGYPEKECPDDSSNICIGDYIGFCSSCCSFPMVHESGASEGSLECVEQNWGCVEVVYENDHTGTTCTYITEPCDQDADSYCDDGEFGNNALNCSNTAWVPEVCEAANPCCIIQTGDAYCISIENHDEMCVD